MLSKVENKSQWKSLLGKALFKTFFHSLEWEEFLEKQFSWIRFERYMWRDELLLSIARCRIFGMKKLVSHPLCEYGGPLPLKEKVDWEGFTNDFKQFFSGKARIKFHPYIRSELNSARVTFWIENFSKKTTGDLRHSFRKTLRNDIRKGENAGITVEECRNTDELKKFYELYVGTMKRHKNIPIPLSAFKFFAESSHCKIFLAKRHGTVVGGSVFLFYHPFIHYFINASDYRLRHLNIGHTILWHVMQEYAGKEYDYFDLGGTRKGSPLEVFKRGWDANEHPIYELGSAKIGFEKEGSLLRDFWSIMPNFLIKTISPKALWMKV